jgi:hypothetical protein
MITMVNLLQHHRYFEDGEDLIIGDAELSAGLSGVYRSTTSARV